MQKPKDIVILGAGFGGLQLARGLRRTWPAARVTLVDQHPYHLFTSNLFEVASADAEVAPTKRLRESITLPLGGFAERAGITCIEASVTDINLARREITAGGKVRGYDYLALALGSESDYLGIPGAAEHSLPLKTLKDALRVRNAVDFAVERHRQDAVKAVTRIVVAGGGYTGVELAGELAGLLDLLCWKYGEPRHKAEIEVVEATNQLIPGFDGDMSRELYGRLRDLGVRVRLQAAITEVDAGHVTLETGDSISYDVLVWSAGVRAKPLPFSGTSPELDRKGRVLTDAFLRARGYRDVFALGDCASIVSAAGVPVPGSAQDAWHEARYLARAIPQLDRNKNPNPYAPSRHGFIVSCGGRWAAVSAGPVSVRGFLGYLVDLGAHVRYYASLVGWLRAVRYVLNQDSLYARNN